MKVFKDIIELNNCGYISVHQANDIFLEKNSCLRVQRNTLDITSMLDGIVLTLLHKGSKKNYPKNIIYIDSKNKIMPEIVVINNLDFDLEIEVFKKDDIEELAELPDRLRYNCYENKT